MLYNIGYSTRVQIYITKTVNTIERDTACRLCITHFSISSISSNRGRLGYSRFKRNRPVFNLSYHDKLQSKSVLAV